MTQTPAAPKKSKPLGTQGLFPAQNEPNTELRQVRAFRLGTLRIQIEEIRKFRLAGQIRKGRIGVTVTPFDESD